MSNRSRDFLEVLKGFSLDTGCFFQTFSVCCAWSFQKNAFLCLFSHKHLSILSIKKYLFQGWTSILNGKLTAAFIALFYSACALKGPDTTSLIDTHSHAFSKPSAFSLSHTFMEETGVSILAKNIWQPVGTNVPTGRWPARTPELQPCSCVYTYYNR